MLYKVDSMKANDVHKMNDEELQSEVKRLRKHLYDLRVQGITEKLENPRQLSQTRRDIARMLTELRQRVGRVD